jgi:uncharacterized double-CXXCG motif protein
MRFFTLEEDPAQGYTGEVNASHKWTLPGIICPACGATWGAGSKAYPSVDLTPLATADFETPRPEPAEEYERLREYVRPLLPPGAVLEPGSTFGPLQGTARGRFGALVSPYSWWLLVRREALHRLRSEGLRGLVGCRTELRFRQRNPPELLELEILPAGRLHPECLPSPRPPPCTRCGRHGLSLPDFRLLDASSAPPHLDLFRLMDFSTVIVCTERFASTCQRLGLDGVAFHPLPVR